MEGKFRPIHRSNAKCRNRFARQGLMTPALDVEKHPGASRMFADRPQEKIPIDAVKVAPYIDVQHPVVPPAALAGLPDGVDRRSAWSVPIRIPVEDRLQDGF